MQIEHPKAMNIILRLQQAGAREALVVGGGVRDLFMGKQPKDIDIEVYGLTYDQIADVLSPHYRIDLVGQAFGVIKIDNEIDVSVPRTENKMGVGHKSFRVSQDPEMTLEQAAARRDFTINSMAIGLDQVTRDPFGGQVDIENRTLRATSDAFVEDPLRVLRGMQFAARFDMIMDDATIEMCTRMLEEFHSLPKERIWEEWKKWALKGAKPSAGLKVLQQTGWAYKFPEVGMMIGVPQDRVWHPEGCVFTHTGYVVDKAAMIAEREQLDEDNRLVLMFSALGHDFGKASTTEYVDGRWRAHGHCEASRDLVQSFLDSIGAPHFIAERVKPLVVEHLIHSCGKPTHRIIRRLANRLGSASIQMLSMLIEADHSGRPPLEPGNPFAPFIEMAQNMELDNDGPCAILMGRHLIDMGVKPGVMMGRLLKESFEAQLDGEFSDLEGAKNWVRGKIQ